MRQIALFRQVLKKKSQAGSPLRQVRKFLAGFSVILLGFYDFGFSALALAQWPQLTVVINEIAWAGSVDSSSDEWIELYNNSDQKIDLNGWSINDDKGDSTYKLEGTIEPKGYYVAERNENAISPKPDSMVIGSLSLANTGDSLELTDGAGLVVDTVNDLGKDWPAGDSSTKGTMERKDSAKSADDNWVTGTGVGSSAVASKGSKILGTPGLANSALQNNVNQDDLIQKLFLSFSANSVKPGDILAVAVDVKEVENLFSYGIELSYDPAVLEFQNIVAGQFLNKGVKDASSFQSALDEGQAGKLLVAEARTVPDKSGVNGSDNLFKINFKVIGSAASSKESAINFGNNTFIASPNADISSKLVGAKFSYMDLKIAPLKTLKAAEGVDRYSLKLSWGMAEGATSYKIYRRDPHAAWKLIGETKEVTFIDNDEVSGSGKIIPFNEYHYKIVPLNGAVEGEFGEISAKESRGLKGDNDRSSKVDGRDLQNLARHFGLTDADKGFDPLLDTTYDGRIDGSDLIDLGVNFAKSYKL